MLREWHTDNQAGLSPHEMHCHQYLATDAATYQPKLTGAERTARERRRRGVQVERDVRHRSACGCEDD
jgi:hypothetical protein